MKVSAVIIRCLGSIMPKSLRRALKLQRPSGSLTGSLMLEHEQAIWRQASRFTDSETVGGQAIDFGAGSCDLGRASGWSVVAIDQRRSPWTREGCLTNGISDMARLAAEGERFDLIVSCSSLQYLSRADVRQFFSLSSDLLKTSGRVFIEFDSRDLLSGRDPRNSMPAYINSFAKIANFLERADHPVKGIRGAAIKIFQGLSIYTNGLLYHELRKTFLMFGLQEIYAEGMNCSGVWEELPEDSRQILVFRFWLGRDSGC